MSKAPAMPMYWDAYLADTTHLTTEEHGAYMLLLAAMWRRNGSVPDDDTDNARILGLTKRRWAKVKERLRPLLVFEDDHISQEKLKKTWENTQEKINKNRQNGKRGGRPRSNENKDLKKANGYVSLNPNESIPEPEPEPYIDDHDRAHAREFRERLLEEMGVDPVSGLTGVGARMIGTMADMETANRWKSDLRLSEAECLAIVREVMRRKRDGPPRGFGYFTAAMSEFAGIKRQPKLTPIEGGRNEPARRPQGDDIARAADAILAAWG